MMFLRRGVMRIRFRQYDLHFRHRDHRQVANEHEEKRKENSKRADERPYIDPGRVKHSPGGRQEVAVQPADDDDETLEPHPGVDAHADEIDDVDVVPEALEPKELRGKGVAEKRADPPVPPVGTEDAVEERVL